MKLFSGRMNRSTFLLAVMVVTLFAVIISRPDAVNYLDTNEGPASAIVLLIALPLIIWQLATAARRLHDIGMSGWLALLLIIPGIQIFLLLMPGTKGPNKYGPQPTEILDVSRLLTNQDNK